MTGPSYHGRTHLPGGTDPIAALRSIPVAQAYRDTTFTVPATATFVYPEWEFFDTNDEDIFTWPGTGSDDGLITCAAGGNYLVLYEVFMATPPTSPDSVTAQPRMTGNRGFIGKTVGANNLTVAEYLTGVSSGAYGWQEFNWFSGGGDLKLQCAKDSGSSCNFETINITIARLGDSLSF